MLGDMSITSFCDFFSLFPLSIISPTPIIYNLGCWLAPAEICERLWVLFFLLTGNEISRV